MPVRLNGSTSGYVELAAPAVAGTTSLELPTDSIKPGLVLVAAQSFSAVSSVSVNNCFTATYDNYKVLVNYVGITTSAQDVNMRLRSSGSDLTTATYNNQRLYGNSTTAAAARTANTTFLQGTSVLVNEGAYHEWEISAPALAQETLYLFRGVVGVNTTLDLYGGGNSNSTAYDGFTLVPVANTITGSLQVFGYRKTL